MSRAVKKSHNRLISEYAYPLVSDSEWRVLVDLYMDRERKQHWYSEGCRDGQCDALQEAAEVISATARILPDDETRQIITSLASIMSVMMTDKPQISSNMGAVS